MLTNTITFGILALVIVIMLILSFFIYKIKNKTQLRSAFLIILFELIAWCGLLMGQIALSTPLNINPFEFDKFVYIFSSTIPIMIFILGKLFNDTKIKFTLIYLTLFIIPIISLGILWTNDLHHLFYIEYSINNDEVIFGNYFIIHTIYSYALLLIGMFSFVSYSVKNSGFFSKQSILIIAGTVIPVLFNLLHTFNIIESSIYLTPITFILGISFYALAVFKFEFINVAPIALQKVVDRISDGFIVINENGEIVDYNNSLLQLFNIKSRQALRNQPIKKFLMDLSAQDTKLTTNLLKAINVTKQKNNTIVLEHYFNDIDKYFNIEINCIYSKKTYLSTMILFKDITQHTRDLETIKNNQDMLMEKERLASLGQLIGGIAHNLKTPIMSISGASEGLHDLVKEYDSSIEDPDVTPKDHHEIASEMTEWINKIHNYTQYMSDIITAVKGQAVNFNNDDNFTFTIEELLQRIDILMKHELKSARINLNVSVEVSSSSTITGDINSLVQVINNMISNSIQAYSGKENENIDLNISENKSHIIIQLKDYASGLPAKVKDKLFKEMITTKGKNGTGLGLYMSYSTIRGHFHGDITVESKENLGTTFNIILPK